MGLFGHRERMPVGILYGGEWFAGSELITTAWTAFAGFAWGHYLEAGRGVMWLPVDANEAANGPLYVPLSRPSLAADRSTFMRRLRSDLERYKPEHEFVIAYSGARDLKSYYAGKVGEFEGVLRPAKGQLLPPYAYQRLIEAEARGEDLSAVALTPRLRR